MLWPGGLLLLLVAVCFLWPLIYHIPPPFDAPNPVVNLPPLSPGHILGTDPVGNDNFSRLVYGGQVSLEVGFSVSVIGLVAGGFLGIGAGYLGGITDMVLMRVLDVLIAFPSLALSLVIAEGLGQSETHIIWALSFFSIPAFGRIARSGALQVREQPFIVAARLAGSRGRWILLRHIAPNVFPALVTFGLLTVGTSIVIEGALDFLGLGIPAPTPTWGGMIALGQQRLSVQPELLLIPSAALLLTVLALNRLGDVLRARWAVK